MRNFVFIHVSKSGGTTLTRNLHLAYPNQICEDKTFRYYRRSGIVQFPRYAAGKLPSWHKGYDDHNTPMDCTGIRGHFTISKWEHLKWPFLTIIRNPVHRIISLYSIWYLRNDSTQARARKAEGWRIREFADFIPNQISTMLGDNLDLFSFVGIFEQFGESIRRLEGVIGVKFPRNLGRYNVTPKKLVISEEDREYIEKVNQKDIELYEQAVERFEETK